MELTFTDFEALFMCAGSFVSGVIIGGIIVVGIMFKRLQGMIPLSDYDKKVLAWFEKLSLDEIKTIYKKYFPKSDLKNIGSFSVTIMYQKEHKN